MPNFWKIVNRVIEESDVILEVLDARFIEESRHEEIEKKIAAKNKKLIYVINKCDLVDIKVLKKAKQKLGNCIFISSRKHLGTTKLRHFILRVGQKKPLWVGVVGYPNVGKSSLINALKGRESAKASAKSGQTRGRQIVSSSGIKLLDTPGVVPFRQNDEMKLALFSSVNAQKIKDPDLVAGKIVSTYQEVYGVDITGIDVYDALEKIALEKKIIMKGGEADVIKISRLIIDEHQKGILPQKAKLYPPAELEELDDEDTNEKIVEIEEDAVK